MKRIFEGKNILVTGAGSGIGLSTVVTFSNLGGRIIMIDKDLSKIPDAIKSANENLALQVDLTNFIALEECFQDVQNKYGHLNCACNAAGIGGVFSPIESYPIDNWDEVMNINVKAIFVAMKHELKLMHKTEGAAIVNCASLFSAVAYPNDAAYVASKHAVVGLTKSAALEYSKAGIRINAISPGFTETNMTSDYSQPKRAQLEGMHAIGRFANPQEIAEGVVWLCSDSASFVCGHNLIIDGGFTIQ